MENREEFESNPITDDIEIALRTRLCEDLDWFIANSTPDDFWTRETSDDPAVPTIKASARPFVRRVWSAKIACSIAFLVVACLGAFAFLMRDASTSKVDERLVDVGKDPAISQESGGAVDERLSSKVSQDLLTDILTVVDYAESKEGGAEEQWESLVRLGERGVSAVSGKFADYDLVQSGYSFESPLRLIAVSHTTEASEDEPISKETEATEDKVVSQETDCSFDSALVSCVDSLSDVGAILRYDPYLWVVETVLSGD